MGQMYLSAYLKQTWLALQYPSVLSCLEWILLPGIHLLDVLRSSSLYLVVVCSPPETRRTCQAEMVLVLRLSYRALSCSGLLSPACAVRPVSTCNRPALPNVQLYLNHISCTLVLTHRFQWGCDTASPSRFSFYQSVYSQPLIACFFTF